MKPLIKQFAEVVGMSAASAYRLRDKGIIPAEAQTLTDLTIPYCFHVRKIASGRFDTEFDITNARARRMHYRANLAELQYKKMAGKLIDVGVAAYEQNRIIELMRSKLMGMPYRIGVETGSRDAGQIARRIIDEIMCSNPDLI